MKNNFKRNEPFYRTITTVEESKLLKSLGLDCSTASLTWYREYAGDIFVELSYVPYREYTKHDTFNKDIEDIYLPCWTIDDFFNILSSNSLILNIEKRSDNTIKGIITYYDTAEHTIRSIDYSLFNLLYKLVSISLENHFIKN